MKRVAGSVNKVILIGNLGRDPEVRTFQSGDKVVNFSVATSETWKDKMTGERKEKTEWHNVSVLNKGLVHVCENYLKKGSKVYIEGQLETRKWTDQSGQERYTTEVVLRPYRGELTMLDGRSGGAAGGGFQDNNYGGGGDFQSGGAPSYGGGQAQSAAAPAPVDDMDDEIPF